MCLSNRSMPEVAIQAGSFGKLIKVRALSFFLKTELNNCISPYLVMGCLHWIFSGSINSGFIWESPLNLSHPKVDRKNARVVRLYYELSWVASVPNAPGKVAETCIENILRCIISRLRKNLPQTTDQFHSVFMIRSLQTTRQLWPTSVRKTYHGCCLKTSPAVSDAPSRGTT